MTTPRWLKILFWVLFPIPYSLLWAQGPTITNLAVTAMTSSTVTIQWTTNQASSSQLLYGTGALNQATPVVGTLVTGHSLTLNGLTGGQVWEYAAVSVNSAGHSTTSTAQNFELCDSESSVTVSGTVNNYYEYGLYTMTWQNQSGQSVPPTLCGAALQQTWTGGLDRGASFGLNLPNNLEIVPSPSNWEIGVTGIDGSIGNFNISFSNSTPSTNISAALQAAAVGKLIHVWYDPATSTFYPPIPGGGGNPASPVGSLQYNNGGVFGGANGDYNTTSQNSFQFGQVQQASVATYSCDGTNCTFQATNNFIAGTYVLLDYTFSASCLYGTLSPALSTGLSSSQFELVESDTQCTGVQSGTGGNASSDNAGLWVYSGLYGISLTAEGFFSGEVPPASSGITLCATNITAPQCSAGDANLYEISMTADNGVFLFSTGTVNSQIRLSSSGFIQIDTPMAVELGGSMNGTVPGSLEFFAGATPISPAAGTVQISAPATVTTYNMNLPGTQGAGALTNDGSGNLFWSTAGHSAFGANSSIDYAFPKFCIPNSACALTTVSSLYETSGTAAGVNGLISEIDLTPTAAPTSFPVALVGDMELNLDSSGTSNTVQEYVNYINLSNNGNTVEANWLNALQAGVSNNGNAPVFAIEANTLYANNNGSGAVGNEDALTAEISNSGSGSVSNIQAVNTTIKLTGASTNPAVEAIRINSPILSGGATITSYYGVDLFGCPAGVTNCYQIYIASSTGAANNYGIYQPGTQPDSTAGSWTASNYISTVTTGTAPFTVTSTTPVANLSIGGNAATAAALVGLTTAPTGSCTTGTWVFSKDGKGSFCKAGTWEVAVTAP